MFFKRLLIFVGKNTAFFLSVLIFSNSNNITVLISSVIHYFFGLSYCYRLAEVFDRMVYSQTELNLLAASKTMYRVNQTFRCFRSPVTKRSRWRIVESAQRCAATLNTSAPSSSRSPPLAHRGKTVRLRALRQGLRGPLEPARAHADALGGQELQVRELQEDVRAEVVPEQTPRVGLPGVGAARGGRAAVGPLVALGGGAIAAEGLVCGVQEGGHAHLPRGVILGRNGLVFRWIRFFFKEAILLQTYL